MQVALPSDYDLLKNSDWDNSRIATNKDVMTALLEQKTRVAVYARRKK